MPHTRRSRSRLGSAQLGGLPTFAARLSDDKVAPKAATRRVAVKTELRPKYDFGSSEWNVRQLPTTDRLIKNVTWWGQCQFAVAREADHG